MNNTTNRAVYLNKNEGQYADEISINNQPYEKVDNLRYGTNPHQTAAYYRLKNDNSPIGNLKIIKNGKNGLSQTNLEDISYSLNIAKYFDDKVCVIMKHVNPCGVAVATTATQAFSKAWEADPRAAFGSTIAFNTKVDKETAHKIMNNFIECVVAPSFSEEAITLFNDFKTYKKNKHLRLLQCGDLKLLPKFVGDDKPHHSTIKTLADGSLVIASPLLTNLKSIDNMQKATASAKDKGEITSTTNPTEQQLKDMMIAWYINLNVRSNGVVIVKNGVTLAVGTGEQDRVGAIEQAIAKFKLKYEGEEELKNAVMASDGFFPFYDGVQIAAEAGINAIIAPAGSIKDYEVIDFANNHKVAMIHAPERCFSHH